MEDEVIYIRVNCARITADKNTALFRMYAASSTSTTLLGMFFKSCKSYVFVQASGDWSDRSGRTVRRDLAKVLTIE